MDFTKAINLKKEIATAVLTKKKSARTFRSATSTNVITVKAEAALLATTNFEPYTKQIDFDTTASIRHKRPFQKLFNRHSNWLSPKPHVMARQ